MRTHPDRTLVEQPVGGALLDHSHGFTLLGSCFAACLMRRLAQGGFRVYGAAMGTLFNSLNLAQHLQAALAGQAPAADLFLQRDGLHFHYGFHSQLSGATETELSTKIEHAYSDLRTGLQTPGLLVLTLGTAHIWTRKSDGTPLANCHKMPGTLFAQRLLSVEAIVQPLADAIQNIREQNPALTVVLTVSPVRHTRLGLAENNLSKSVLRVACHQLTQVVPDCHYFPAYEALIDDLRDYRYYADDLIHPSPKAENYIYDLFAQTWLTAESRQLQAQWQGVQQALAHRPMQPGSESHRKHLQQLQARVLALPDVLPKAPVLAEIARQLVSYSD